jgi:hypothetical protein
MKVLNDWKGKNDGPEKEKNNGCAQEAVAV